DKSITLPVSTITLSGSGTDADGTVAGYLWTKISGPSSFNIVNPSSPVTDVSALVQGTYVFQLKVTDNSGATATSTVQVTVNAAANIPPVANAGSDKSITLPINTITLSGSGTDADGTVAGYLWTKISGPSSFNIVNPSSPVTDVSALVQGTYVFQLKVTDNNGATSTSTVQISVNAAANIPPIANAGTFKSINLPVSTVTLSGSGTDADGTIAAYLWTKISGPSSFNIVNSSSPVTDVSALVQGTYVFQLKVTDNSGATATSTVQVTVNAAANIPPVANAGSDKSITLPVSTITLSGSGTDADGTVAGYLWTKISGPSSFNIVNSSSPVTDVSALVQGTYVFQLKVTDNSGATATDTLQVTVNPANIPPTANAGLDQTITLPVNSVSLSGSGKVTNGTIVGYLWRQVSGPSSSSPSPLDSSTSIVYGLISGTYQYELTVKTNLGEIAKDTVAIIVGAPRLIPIAKYNQIKVYPNPVVDQATLEINSAVQNSSISVIVTNIKGSVIYKKILNYSQYKLIVKINMSTLIKGTYMMSVTFNSGERLTKTISKL
ncbi:MAG: T9SS type A sorting domain-containing protein, partial [Bacteroidota bacterium]|nr:T9SS type A sorting domain-containing protein [Bacteroidota bacterium]